MNQSVIDILPVWQLVLVAVCFVWSGFVRSGLGFGGAALTLPILLIFADNPLWFLPAICFHLLFFSMLTVATRLRNIDWLFLVKILLALSIPFAIGLAGLLNLSGSLLSAIVYTMTLFYGISYVAKFAFSSQNKFADSVFIAMGGYASGVSLIGAPLIVAAGTRYLQPQKARDTFFVLWIIMVLMKISTFVAADVHMQWQLMFLMFPMAALGHYLGLKAHEKIISGDKSRFERTIGIGLITLSVLGLINIVRGYWF